MQSQPRRFTRSATASARSATAPTGASVAELPHWQMTSVYSSLEGDDYLAAVAQFEALLGQLEAQFDRQQIGRLAAPPARCEPRLVATLSEVLEGVNRLLALSATLGSYVWCFFSTNSYDAVALREISRLEMLDTRQTALTVRLRAWIGSLAPLVDELAAAPGTPEQHAFFLSWSAAQSRYQMSEQLERLAAELSVDGGRAFARLQQQVTSQVKVPIERNGQIERLPIAAVHNLSRDADSAIRRQAYYAEIEGWRSIRTPVAVALNAVKGTALTLTRRRGRASVLDEALEDNRIDRPTLDALVGSIRESLPIFRRYLASKARKLGTTPLPWWDLFAPVGGTARVYTWSEARALILDKFATFDPQLAALAERAFAEGWIDAQPRDGKSGGGFCTELPAVEESRILVNFDGSFDQLSTLAHELGHAWHNECQRGLPALVRGCPSTLAETASIFCETLVTEAALKTASPEEQLEMLEAQLCGATQVCLDIYCRFLFEERVIAARAEGEIGPDALCEAMLKAQAETYADAVDPATYHPYMWLWKPHYYHHEHNYYNFPYAFGHLFGLGLYAAYEQSGADFVPRYRDLLRDSGRAYAAPLAARFGVDIRQADFWRASLAIVERQVARYEALD